MDCKTARHLLELERPWHSELDAEESEALRGHLTDCPDCASAQRTEARMDEAIGRAMRAVSAPDGLRDRILAKLAHRRDSWYRRRLFIGTAAAAAAVLLAVGGWVWLNQPKPVDLDAWADISKDWPRTAEEVDNWYQQHGYTVRAPRNFNYHMRTYVGWDRFHGHHVPMITLTARDGSVAHIYILDASRFDLSSLDEILHGSGEFTVQALPRDPKSAIPFGYVIRFTAGSSLDVFFAPGRQG